MGCVKVRDARIEDMLDHLKQRMSSPKSPAMKSLALRQVREESGVQPFVLNAASRRPLYSQGDVRWNSDVEWDGREIDSEIGTLHTPDTTVRVARKGPDDDETDLRDWEGNKDEGHRREEFWSETVVCKITPWGLKRAVQREMEKAKYSWGW